LLNAEREDVKLLMSAVKDELVTEMSFAFMLNDGEWNDDYDQFRITEADINRGDVSAVNYGANPYTSISARSYQFMHELKDMPLSVQRAALVKLSATVSGTRTALEARDRISRAVDADENVNNLVAALDATLDEASELVASVDTSSLPEEVAQAIGLLVAAEVTADELMVAMNIPDPDEPGETQETQPEKETASPSEPAEPLARSRAMYMNRLMLEVEDLDDIFKNVD
jgi:hypothetical protein